MATRLFKIFTKFKLQMKVSTHGLDFPKFYANPLQTERDINTEKDEKSVWNFRYFFAYTRQTLFWLRFSLITWSILNQIGSFMARI